MTAAELPMDREPAGEPRPARTPTVTISADSLAWLAAPRPGYSTAEAARRTIRRLENAGIDDEALEFMRQHIGGDL